MHVFPLLQFSFFSGLLYTILWLFFDIPPLYLVLLLIAVVTLLFFVLSVGSISKNLDNDVVTLNVSTIWKRTKLRGSLKCESLWDYEFATDSQVGGNADSASNPAGANDINSYLVFTDSGGQQVVLRERIFLDTRFPNEAKYHSNFNTKNIDVYDVQRTDKIKKRIEELQLVNLPKAR